MIYRKGEFDGGLRDRALDQQMSEMSETRGMTSQQRYERESNQGITGAKNVANLNTTVQEANDYPETLGGAVSGAALAKLRKKKVDDKKDKEREAKRR